MSKPWPSSDCEFVLRPHEIAEYNYHLEVECDFPNYCNYRHQLRAHTNASTAHDELMTLWQSRPPSW